MKKTILISIIGATLLHAEYTRDDTLEVVTDSKTALIWQDNSEVTTKILTFDASQTYCNDLEFAGYDDWRVPSIRELLTTIDTSKYNPAMDSTFQNIGGPGYWSSTLNASTEGMAWQAYINYGRAFVNSKGSDNYIRCVRGESLDGKQKLTRDDTLEVVIDEYSGLMWQDNAFSAETKQDWETAVEYCEDLELAGYSDWELPSADTLRSIVDYSRYGKAISSKFDNIGGDSIEYWSSSTYSANPAYAWAMFFNDGLDNGYTRANSYYTRCVRQHTEGVTPTPAPTSPSTEPTPTPTGEPTPTPTSGEGLCEIPKNSMKIVDSNKCELKEDWEIGETVNFQFFYKNNLGKEFEGDTYEKCAVKNSEVAIFNNVKSEITFKDDGVASLTCVYYDMVTTHQFYVGEYEKDINSAIVVVGKGSENDKLKEAFVYLGNEVYRFLHSQGYSDDEIVYLNSFGEQKLFDNDLDGNKDNVVDKVDYSFDDFKSALLEMPVSNNPLLIYLIDHGLRGGVLLIDPEKKILADEFNLALTEFQDKTKRKVVVVVDSCYSGAFVETLKGPNRVIMSSGTADQVIPMSTSGISFTNYFLKNLQDKKSVKDSFDSAYNSYRKIAKNTFPQADFSDEETASKPFGFLFNAAADVIKSFTGKSALKLPQSTRQTFSLKADNLIGIEKSTAYVTLTPPQTVTVNPNSQDVIEIKSEKVPLTYNASTGEFTGEYELSQEGYYETIYEIVDEAKDKVISDSVTIQVGESTRGVEIVESSELTLDVPKGWSLLALPTNANLDNPLGKFNKSKEIYTFKSNSWSHNPTKLEYGQGFWINSNEESSYSFAGSSYKSDLNVDSGWKLLGTGEDISVSGLSFSNIWVYRNSEWLKKDNIGTISATEGFWIKQ